MSNGKGMGPMKGYNQAKYEANYDRIFRQKNKQTKKHEAKTNTGGVRRIRGRS